jgi:DNA polymerase
VLLYPLYHPAAALYTPSMLKVLSEDFARIPALIERTDAAVGYAPTQSVTEAPVPAPAVQAEPVQLGLF